MKLKLLINKIIRRVGAYIIQGPFVVISKLKRNIFVDCKMAGKVGTEHMFGYYDKSPWNADVSKMCLLRIPFSDKTAKSGDIATIELTDSEGNYIRDIADVRVWNSQMGCRLQWLGPDFVNRIIYNDCRENRLVSVCRDLRTNTEEFFDIPVYDVSRNGKYALSLDFKRLEVFRAGYGYNLGQSIDEYKVISDVAGICKLNLETGSVELVISLKTLIERENYEPERMSSVRVNHIMINPDSTRFIFLFRFRVGQQETTRLYTSDPNGENLFLFSTNNLVSHASWLNDTKFVVWADISPKGQHYYILEDFQTMPVDIIGESVLNEDGHPTFSPDGQYMLTDTYNNRARQRSLLIYDCKSGDVRVLGRFYSPFKYSRDLRCDLHPRWSPDGKMICFDSAFHSGRQVYTVKV